MVHQLSRKFGNNSVRHENLKLDVEYNLFVVSRTLQINRVGPCLLHLWSKLLSNLEQGQAPLNLCGIKSPSFSENSCLLMEVSKM